MTERGSRGKHFSSKIQSALRTRLTIGAAIFLLAFGVRLLSWHDTRLEVGKVQTAVTADYQRVAQLIRDGGLKSFFSSSSPLADLNNLGHPPGYSVLWAWLNTSEPAIQFLQIICDALAAVLIFLIVAEILSLGAAVISGLLAAFSPQLAWNSVLLLPDSISVLPILVAVYLIARGAKKPRMLTFLGAGMLVGVSCWLRANAMLLAPFMAAAVLLLSRQRDAPGMDARGRGGWQFALAVLCGTLLIVLPLTIRNAIVFHRLIPISLGAGQTLLEGIADYDHEGRFGIAPTDAGIMKQEAEIYQRPDYYGTLFDPDGVERERARLRRGFAVIRAHPFWFATVMARRAASMMRLERARLISTETAVSHSMEAIEQRPPVWVGTPLDLVVGGQVLSSQAQVFLADKNLLWLAINGDGSNYGAQFASPNLSVVGNMDYVVSAPVKVTSGRMKVVVQGTSGKIYSNRIVEAREMTSPGDQPVQQLSLPFVSRRGEQARVVFSNEASNPPHPSIQVGIMKVHELGPSRFLWTRYPRIVVHAIQRIFLTAVMLPLAIIGLVILIWRKESRALVILSFVPLYYFFVQSIVHTEYRYVLAVNYFLFAFVGVTVCAGAVLMKQVLPRSVPGAIATGSSAPPGRYRSRY